MTKAKTSQIIKSCVETAWKSWPDNSDQRARCFVAQLSGALELDFGLGLSDAIFGILSSEAQPAGKKTMSAFTVTVRQLGRPPLKFFAIGACSGDVGNFIALHFGACGISIKPL